MKAALEWLVIKAILNTGMGCAFSHIALNALGLVKYSVVKQCNTGTR